MHILQKGEAFPQIRRRSRGSSLTGPSVIWTSLAFHFFLRAGAFKVGITVRGFGRKPYQDAPSKVL